MPRAAMAQSAGWHKSLKGQVTGLGGWEQGPIGWNLTIARLRVFGPSLKFLLRGKTGEIQRIANHAMGVYSGGHPGPS